MRSISNLLQKSVTKKWRTRAHTPSEGTVSASTRVYAPPPDYQVVHLSKESYKPRSKRRSHAPLCTERRSYHSDFYVAHVPPSKIARVVHADGLSSPRLCEPIYGLRSLG
ncbi:hypothetical protein Adt_23076 [Abeliophyllum distichum]|uniref:Uncharacterized protein n=1 Tax=Abeliophyllum distichum TaxID=126358 RepID=A0ABD1S9T6_9LAMI